MKYGLAHHYHLGESTFISGDIRCDFIFLNHFCKKFLKANRIASDDTIHKHYLNPFMKYGLAHHIHLGESTFISGNIRCDFIFLNHFCKKFL